MIHYFLEGDLGYNYEESWRTHAGHMEFKKWDSKNLPFDDFPILKQFAKDKRWSILSDFVRRWAVLEFGGIYLDYDVELIKPIDKFLGYDCFISIEGPPAFGNMAVSGGKKGSEHHKRLLEMYLDVISGKRNYLVQLEVACSPWVVSDYIVELKGDGMGDKEMNEVCNYKGLTTIPKRMFYPYNWNEHYSPDVITEETYGIHWWKKSWS